MIDFNFDKQCYGCRACENVCSVNAISIHQNAEGFLVPKVDEKLCVNCKKCEKVCPKLTAHAQDTTENQDIYVSAYRKEGSNYKGYTSSGIFHEIAKRTISSGGKVCGCVWNEHMEAEHILTDNMNDVSRMSYSKYVQSNMMHCYKEIETALKTNIAVLFCGTPCQVAALKKYLRKEYSNLFSIAIVCHGVPSPKVWRTYKETLESENGAKMISANFRYKGKYGWITPFTYYEFDNGKNIKKLSFTEDPYVIAFGADILHRNTCYTCQYKGSFSGADLITGDFWGCSSKLLSASKNKGISAVIIHTEKGQKLINSLTDVFVIEQTTRRSIISENKPVFLPVKYNPVREQFYKSFVSSDSLEYMFAMFNRRKYRIKRVLYRFSVFELLKKIKYHIQH